MGTKMSFHVSRPSDLEASKLYREPRVLGPCLEK